MEPSRTNKVDRSSVPWEVSVDGVAAPASGQIGSCDESHKLRYITGSIKVLHMSRRSLSRKCPVMVWLHLPRATREIAFKS